MCVQASPWFSTKACSTATVERSASSDELDRCRAAAACWRNAATSVRKRPISISGLLPGAKPAIELQHEGGVDDDRGIRLLGAAGPHRGDRRQRLRGRSASVGAELELRAVGVLDGARPACMALISERHDLAIGDRIDQGALARRRAAPARSRDGERLGAVDLAPAAPRAAGSSGVVPRPDVQLDDAQERRRLAARERQHGGRRARAEASPPLSANQRRVARKAGSTSRSRCWRERPSGSERQPLLHDQRHPLARGDGLAARSPASSASRNQKNPYGASVTTKGVSPIRRKRDRAEHLDRDAAAPLRQVDLDRLRGARQVGDAQDAPRRRTGADRPAPRGWPDAGTSACRGRTPGWSCAPRSCASSSSAATTGCATAPRH